LAAAELWTAGKMGVVAWVPFNSGSPGGLRSCWNAVVGELSKAPASKSTGFLLAVSPDPLARLQSRIRKYWPFRRKNKTDHDRNHLIRRLNARPSRSAPALCCGPAFGSIPVGYPRQVQVDHEETKENQLLALFDRRSGTGIWKAFREQLSPCSSSKTSPILTRQHLACRPGPALEGSNSIGAKATWTCDRPPACQRRGMG